MRPFKTIAFLFCISMNFSCNSKQEKEVDITEVTEIYDYSNFWVNQSVTNMLSEKTSFLEVQEAITLSGIFWPESKEAEGALLWWFHEEIPFLLESGDEAYRLIHTESGEELGTAYFDEDDKVIHFDGLRFTAERFDGLNFRTVERYLFAGEYLTESGEPVSFFEDGYISGFDSLNYYEATLGDLDPISDVNMFEAGFEKDSELIQIAYKFDGDKLKLYRVDCTEYIDDFCIATTFGKHIITLQRK